MSYESPIKLITDFEYKIKEELEENVIKAVCSYTIDINRDELFKLLLNDRKQYDKGYADGKLDAVKHGRWILNRQGNWACSLCGNDPYHSNMHNMNYCPNCGAKMDEVEE